MSNSILTVSTISNLTIINGLSANFDNANQVIFIGTKLDTSTNLPAGVANVFLGSAAGANYTGVASVGIGATAGAFNTGTGNNSIGYGAGSSSSGSANNFIGYGPGQNCSGSYVNAIGFAAAASNAASFVDAFGTYAGYQNVSTGSNLIAIGSDAGRGTIGAANIYIGAQAGYGTNVSNVQNAIVIGGSAGVAGGVYAVGTRAVIIGTNSTAGSDSIAIGTGVLARNTANIAIGANAGYNGPLSIVIGSNTALSTNTLASNVIAIGTNAASNILALDNTIYIGSNAGYRPTTSNTFVLYSTSTGLPTLQSDLSRRWLGVGCVPTVPLDVAGQIRTTSNIINTINVTTISAVGTLALSTANYSTYFNLVYNGGTTVTVSLPGTTPLNGSYWVLKNNSTVNYTIAYTGGVLNYVGGPTSSYLQAGNGVTLIYAGANSVYYTF
jgi:hypothetical protein